MIEAVIISMRVDCETAVNIPKLGG